MPDINRDFDVFTVSVPLPFKHVLQKMFFLSPYQIPHACFHCFSSYQQNKKCKAQ